MTDAQLANHTRAEAAEIRTFLIADVRGYTQFTVDRGDASAASLATRFAQVTHDVVSARDGTVLELRGDEALAVFSSSRQALRTAVDLQRIFAEESAADPSLPLRVGIGLDAGEAIPVDGGFRGAALNLAARLCSLAGPGEVLATETVTSIARKLDGLEYRDRGTAQLKGFADPVRIIQVAPESTEQTGLPSPWPELPMPIGGFLGALPATPIVAREAELERVIGAVEVVGGGSGRLVLLAGEPGAGKTRLAQEVMLELRNRAFLVATGVCYEARQGVPYYPFLDALGTIFGGAPSAVREQAPQRWPYLGRLLPEASFPAVSPTEDGDQEQERLFRAITGILQAITDERPVALLLDDLHWADASSLDLLQHLARHTRAFPVLLLGTYRDMEVGRQHPLEQALLDLTREQLVERIAVRRLDPEGTAALIGVTFGEEEISAEFNQLVYRHTEGNAFFTQEVLRAMVERGDVFRKDGAWDRRSVEEIQVPESVRSVIGQRLSRLGEEPQDVLREASVLGQTFAFEELMAMSGRAEDRIEASLEAGIEAGLIREAGRDSYAFNHALTQQALYDELSSRRRRRLHLAAGEGIETLPEHKRRNRVGELAWHFIEADEAERALHYSLLAGDQAAALFARSEAKQHFQTALELARETGGRPRIADAAFKLGSGLFAGGEFDRALPLLEEAADLYEDLNDPAREGRALLMIILIYVYLELEGQAAQAEERTMRLVDTVVTREASRDQVLFYHELGGRFNVKGKYQRGLEAADRAVSAATALGDELLSARMELRRAEAVACVGNVRMAVRVAEEVIPRAESAGDLETLAEALADAAEFSMLAGEFDRSYAYRQRERDAYERLGTLFARIFVLVNLSQLELYRGNWAAGRDLAERALAWGESATILFPARVARWHLGSFALATGNWERAAQLLDQAASERQGTLQVQRYLLRDLAQLDVLQGYPERALERLEVSGLKGETADNDTLFVLPIMAWAELESGKVDVALERASEAVEGARERENALVLVDALRVRGSALAAKARKQEAADAFAEAVHLAQRMGYPYAEMKGLYEWGLLHAARGDMPAARERLQQALIIGQRLGAGRDVTQTEEALARTTEP